jgi:hypothetical protein
MRIAWGLGVLLVAAGCSVQPDWPEGTGAQEVVQGYYEALLRGDTTQAYAALDPPSRARCSQSQFAQRVGQYRQGFGFEPDAVHVRSCQEQGGTAIAHVVFTGLAAGHQKYFKEVVELRHGDTGWGVVLPANFGQGRVRG